MYAIAIILISLILKQLNYIFYCLLEKKYRFVLVSNADCGPEGRGLKVQF